MSFTNVSNFSVSVAGRTLTPSGPVFINDAGLCRPHPYLSPVTLSASVDGTLFDIYAEALFGNFYQLIALPQGTGIGGRTDIVLVGTATDYPSLSQSAFLPSLGGALDAYISIATTGLHVKPFGGTGASPYGQLIVESPGRTSDLSLFASGSGTYATISSPAQVDIKSTAAQLSLDGGTSVQITSATSTNIGGGAVSIAPNSTKAIGITGTGSGGDITIRALAGTLTLEGDGAAGVALTSTGGPTSLSSHTGTTIGADTGGVTINPTAGGVTVAPTAGGVSITPTAGGVTIAPVAGDIALNTGKLITNTASPGNLTQESWTGETLVNSWANFGGGTMAMGRFKDSEGVVHLRGFITGGNASTTAFTLSSGYRPSAQVAFSSAYYNGAAYANSQATTIGSAGAVQPKIAGTGGAGIGIEATFDTR